MPGLSRKDRAYVFILGPLHPSRIAARFCLQFEERVDVMDEVPSFASIGVIFLYFILVEFVDF
jgi:hypothetical protein